MKLVWQIGKVLQFLGLIIVLGGVFLSVEAGMHDQSMKSQRVEVVGLLVGGGLFLGGWAIVRATSR